MRVTTVTAQVKYSQDTGHGAWKSIEIGAEASVDGKETWTEAQARLYQQLGQQLRVLWANGNGNKAPESLQDGAESTVAAPQPAEQPNQPNGSNHHCQQHGLPFREYSRGNSRWWAHKDGAKWCRESSTS